MATKSIQVSHLPEATSVTNEDLVMISQQQKDGTYVSKKVKATVMGGVSATTVTNNYTASITDTLLACQSDSDIMVTLYSATGSGNVITVKNIGRGRVFVEVTEGDLVRGSSKKIAINTTHTITFADTSSKNWSVIYSDA